MGCVTLPPIIWDWRERSTWSQLNLRSFHYRALMNGLGLSDKGIPLGLRQFTLSIILVQFLNEGVQLINRRVVFAIIDERWVLSRRLARYGFADFGKV